MKRQAGFILTLTAVLGLTAAAFAAGAKTYQVTGPVLEVTDSMIALQKGGERWEFNRGSNTKVTGELKVGERVTITYAMSAVTIEVKSGKAEKPEKKNAAEGEPSPSASPKK
jgi:hypothetical protein